MLFRSGGAVVARAVVCAIGVGGADVYRGVRGWFDPGDDAGRDRREPSGIVVAELRTSRLSRGPGVGESRERGRRTYDDVPDCRRQPALLTSRPHLHRWEIYVRDEGGYGILPSSSSVVREM